MQISMKIWNLLVKIEVRNTSVEKNHTSEMLAQAELNTQLTSTCLLLMYFPGFVCNAIQILLTKSFHWQFLCAKTTDWILKIEKECSKRRENNKILIFIIFYNRLEEEKIKSERKQDQTFKKLYVMTELCSHQRKKKIFT